MSVVTCTRRLQFCMGHRVWKHESKCANLHGHNYVLYLTAEAPELDDIGRVIDFSVLKELFDPWIQENWDHGFMYCIRDVQTHAILTSEQAVTHKRWAAPFNPTAEEIARWVLHELGPRLLHDTPVKLTHVKLYETENCFAEVAL